MNVAYNVDCMEYMKTLPDKAFDLAVVDPPYGDGNGGRAKRFGGMFGAVYGENTRAHVAGVHERESRRDTTDSMDASTSTRPVHRTGGIGRRSTGKKLWRGMLPRRRTIFKSFSAFHAIKSFGAVIISRCRRRAAS